MKIGQLEIDNDEALAAGIAIGLVALFGHSVAKSIATKTAHAKQPLSMIPQFSPMKTIDPNTLEVIDDETPEQF